MTSIYVLPNGKVVKTQRYYEVYDDIQAVECFEGQKVEFHSIDKLKTLESFPGVIESAINAIKLSLL